MFQGNPVSPRYLKNPKRMDSMAPFDTTFTPSYRMKIVGGKQVYVPDSQPAQTVLPENQDLSARVENARIQSNTNISGSQRISPVQPKQNGKSSAEMRNTWTSHSVLPPISARVLNNTAPILSNPPSEAYFAPHNAPHDAPISAPTDGSALPSASMDKHQEMDLLHKIAENLGQVNMNNLKDVYNEISRHDTNLTGVAHYSDFIASLEKCQIYIPAVDLRHLAVSHSSGNNRVNYEKALAFIASAIKLKNSSPSDNAKYFQSPRNESAREGPNLDFMSIDLRPKRPVNERAGAQGKLMQLVETQIMQGDRPLDLEGLRNHFNLADRLHRGSLSHGEIKEICYKNRVPIQESVINHILDRCGTTGDGQYRWSDFMEFLEKVQPSSTGLNFSSKQPLDYVKKLPEPNESWPKSEFTSFQEPPSTFRQVATDDSSLTHVQNTPQNSEHTSLNAEMQTGNNIQSEADDPWFERYTKLAEALYRNDHSRTGRMKSEELSWLVIEYNEIYNLKMSTAFIEDKLRRNTVAGHTDINNLLKDLMTSPSAKV